MSVDLELVAKLQSTLLEVASTTAQNAFGKILAKVLGGTVVGITRQRELTAVLISIKQYKALLAAAEKEDPLVGLRAGFDKRFAAMQTPKAKAGVVALFSATDEDLGRAAVKGSRKRG